MKHISTTQRTTALYTVSVLSFLFGLHESLPSYFNSSFLSTIIDTNNINIIYAIEAGVSILALLLIHNVVRKFGNYKTAIGLIVIQMFVLYGMITYKALEIVIPLFILSLTIKYLIPFTLDIFLEKITDGSNTGAIRGQYMTVMNSAWIIAPLIGSVLIFGNNYKGIYVAAFALLIPLAYIINRNYSKFSDPHYPQITLTKTIKTIFHNSDISKLILINITLQVFYAWMVVYSPIYLNKVIGFGWDDIGIIFTIMLVPFVLLENPLGRIADNRLGEKEIMATGFIIMGLSTIALSFITFRSVAIWAGLLFITRIGAAAAEIMIETYFFKKVRKEDTEILGMFRITRPASYLIAPIITATGVILFTNEAWLFSIVGCLCILALIPIFGIRDTA